MPWLWFSGALLVVWVLQSTIVPFFWTSIDLCLVLAIVWALAAPRIDARIAGFIVGLAQDLGSRDPFGLHAFTLGLTAAMLTVLRERMFRQTFFTRSVIAFICTLPGQYFIPLHLRWIHNLPSSGLGAYLLDPALKAIICALLAAAILELPALTGRRRNFVYSRQYD